MFRIIENSESSLEIKRSKFITKLYYVTTVQEATALLQHIRKLYKDATHCCYAYIIDQEKKSSDDGEPGGTAGVPMLDLLDKRQMNYILCVVIRYFGGIKLGAGGLVRAYSNCVRIALEQATLKELEAGYRICLHTEFSKENQLIQLLGKNNILKKEYRDDLYIEAIVSYDLLQTLQAFSLEIIENVWI